MTDSPGCAGGEGRNREIWEVDAQRAELAIFRTKLVSPLRDAVCFIDGEECDWDASQQRDRVLARQPLRGEIQQTVLPCAGFLGDVRLFTAALSAVQHRRGNPHLRKLGCLVLHQRNQRRDHDGGLARHQSRQLVTQRLAASRGHHDASVTTAEQALHDLFLQRPERAVAPVALQEREKVSLGRHSHSIG